MKRFFINILALAMIFTVAGCANKTAANIDTDAVADKLASEIKFADQMSNIEEKTVLKIYGLDEDSVKKVKAYESTGATAEEIAIFEAKDEEAAKTVKAASEQRIKDQRAGFEDYQPKEMAKLKSPVLKTSGKYVFLCVSDDNSTANKVIDSFIK